MNNYSRLNEDEVIHGLIANFPSINHFCVDIGASSGRIWSNVWKLMESGWSGLAVECDPTKTPDLIQACGALKNTKVFPHKITPLNVNRVLEEHHVPTDFGVLSLDIDGYDYHVLKAMLRTHKPSIICCEVNPCVPPPIKFSVKFDPEYWWGVDTFFGMSLSAANELLSANGYHLWGLVFDNAVFSNFKASPKTLEELWVEGYLNAIPTIKESEYCQDVARKVVAMSEADAHDFLNNQWIKYEGKYELWQ